jgi:predicted enzyme related to lactoylglutathione lyase
MAFLQDPQGAHFAIFTGREHQGASRQAPKPGSFSWTELMTTDAAAARQFYGCLLGWTFTEMPMGPGLTYTVFQVAGKPAAGMMQMEGPMFQGVPPHWTSYLSVADCDAAAARAAELGAKVLVPPQDVPRTGRFSILQDPTGAVFAIIAFLPM